MLEEYYGYVYATIDLRNGKLYVGQKKGLVEKTKSYFGSGTIITKIIEKHGTSFLRKVVLEFCYTQKDLQERETYYKYLLNVFDRRYGYNIAIVDNGGDNITYNPNRDFIIEKHRKKSKEIWENKTEEELQAWRKQVKERYKNLDYYEKWLKANRDPKKIEKMLKSREETFNNLSKEEQEKKIKERSEVKKKLWNTKSEEEKQEFIKKMVEINNSEEHVKNSKESRACSEYKELISKRIKEYCSTPEGKKQRKLSAIQQWKDSDRKNNYSKNRKEWHSNPDNKKKHSDSLRCESSYVVEEKIKELASFTIYDLIDFCDSTYNVVSYLIEKYVETGFLIKGKNRGNKPIIYYNKDMYDELCENKKHKEA